MGVLVGARVGVIVILLVAVVISFVVGEHTDAFVILAIIAGNAGMGYYQEYNAEKSIRLLQKMSAQFAMVLRNDNPAKIEASAWVPGTGPGIVSLKRSG